MQATSTPVIEFDNVSKSYRSKVALTGVSFRVPGGSIFGCVGPNGAGKTTMVRLILGLLSPDTGTVKVFGSNAVDLSVLDRRRIGCVLESTGIYNNLTVRQNLEFFARLYGTDGLSDKISIGLSDLDMEEYENQPAGRLSKGMKQQLAIRRATLHHPEILVLDEPAAGLDPIHQKETRDLLDHYRQEGHAIFLCSHDMSQVERLCDMVLFLKEGNCLAVASASDLPRRQGADTWIVRAVSRESMRTLLTKLDGRHRVNGSKDSNQIELSIPAHEEAEFLGFLSSEAGLIREVRRVVPTFEETFFRLMEDR